MPQNAIVARGFAAPQATRATNDETLLQSWLASLTSPHTRTNFKVTAERFLEALHPLTLREATVEDVTLSTTRRRSLSCSRRLATAR